MFYIILNVYIFNWFNEPLAINSMAYEYKNKKVWITNKNKDKKKTMAYLV